MLQQPRAFGFLKICMTGNVLLRFPHTFPAPKPAHTREHVMTSDIICRRVAGSAKKRLAALACKHKTLRWGWIGRLQSPQVCLQSPPPLPPRYVCSLPCKLEDDGCLGQCKPLVSWHLHREALSPTHSYDLNSPFFGGALRKYCVENVFPSGNQGSGGKWLSRYVLSKCITI